MARPAAIPARIGLYAAALLIAGYAGFPIYWMIVSSLREPSALLNQIELLPSPLSLQSYRNLLELTDYPAHFANSAIVALVTVAVTMVFSVMIAYAVTRQRIR
ncbi:carbohydrate ABC transporter permease, partial [Verminephrobacter sp. Larva24]